jgi:hypothetical protein
MSRKQEERYLLQWCGEREGQKEESSCRRQSPEWSTIHILLTGASFPNSVGILSGSAIIVTASESPTEVDADSDDSDSSDFSDYEIDSSNEDDDHHQMMILGFAVATEGRLSSMWST